MELLGYLASVLIGISLGMVGSGGSILTVPVLVYLMGMNPLLATTSSLFIVGITSLAGGIRAYLKRLVDFKAVTEFGIPSIFSIFITRHHLLPAIPAHIFYIGREAVSREMLLMIIFAILMLGASISMIRRLPDTGESDPRAQPSHKAFPVILIGLAIGVITGMLGAGGGFLIIPTLVLFLKIPMKTAVGTSLLVIAINSLFGFLFSLNQFSYNWILILSFTVLAITGLFIGSKIAEKISPGALKKGFGWFVMCMGVYIIVKELFI
ncbi:MAG: sulfite exporter TauE/SafE family protein [Chitinophagaceae bacterium]